MRRLICILVLNAVTALISLKAFAISAIHIDIDSMQSGAGQARGVSLNYRLNTNAGALAADVAVLKIAGQIKAKSDRDWSDASISCANFSLPQATSPSWRCENGLLSTLHIKAPFSLSVTPSIHTQGKQFSALLHLKQASLSDASGLHAAEKLSAEWSLMLIQDKSFSTDEWHWQTNLNWQEGEVFWQPFYLASGGHQLQATGSIGAQVLNVESAQLGLKDIGNAHFNGQLRLSDYGLQTLSFAAQGLNLANLYPALMKPLLEKTAFNNLEMNGKANLLIEMQEGTFKTFTLDLQNADIEDNNGRFGLYKLNANLPWSYTDATQAKLSYQGGHVLHIPLGAANLDADLNRYSVTAKQFHLPVLDGALDLSDISAAWLNQQLHWHLRANIQPIDMVSLSKTIGWPRMDGKVTASIPLVTYSAGELSTDGEMKFGLFNGSIAVQNLALQTPLGSTPKLSADLQIKQLDLGDLTRTFSFGAIEGKLDGNVNHLELSNWQPTHFEADFHSSSGRYSKKISQRAVENISSLGGAGAVAAVQRSFLRFFKEFNYEKIGLTCKLNNDTCEMGGIESTPQGYTIVKGSGIPSITVMGYNHSVSWGELLTRVKRITANNAAVIK